MTHGTPDPFPASPGTVGHPAWTAVVSLSLGVFGLVTAEFLPVSLLTPISQDLGITPGTAGQTITATAVIGAIAGPGVVIGTRNLDRRWVLLTLTMLLIVSSTIAALANSLPMLLAARLLLGVGLGGFWAMSAALAMRLVPEHLMPRAMAVVFTGVSVATVCAAPLGAWIGATLGWRAAFALAAGVGILAFLVQALSVPSLPPRGSASLSTMMSLLSRPRVRIGLIVTLIIVPGHFAGFTYIRPYLEEIPRFSVEMISLVLLAYGVAGFFGNLLGGVIAGRSTTVSIAFGAGLLSASALLMLWAGALAPVSWAAIVLWGLGFGILPVSIQTHVTRAASDEAESVGAMLLTTFQVAISSGAVLGGLLVDTQGPLGVVTFVGIVCALGSVVMLARGGRQVALEQG
ncbi:MFS transporter [Pseudorhizobium sp. NPDC055634]